MNKIIFEIIAVLLWVYFNHDLNLLTEIESFLLITIALRTIWNSAIIIHGLGHSLTIAAVDRRLSALKITHILEHRDSKTVLKSLLPFQAIFIPGLNLEDNLWLAAGDATRQID